MLLFETLKIKKSHFLNSSQVNALHMAFNQTYGQIFTLTIATDEHHTSKQQTFVAICGFHLHLLVFPFFSQFNSRI